MFRVTADSLAAYLDFDPERKPDLVRLHALIRETAPALKRYFHRGTPAGEAGMRMKMIGYGKFRYAIKSGESTQWPVIGVALQKNYISVCVSVRRGGAPIGRMRASSVNCERAPTISVLRSLTISTPRPCRHSSPRLPEFSGRIPKILFDICRARENSLPGK